MMLLWFATAGTVSFAAETDHWVQLHDALLIAQAYGDSPQAEAMFDTLAKSLSIDDPVRPEALYWLGHARYQRADTQGALEALRDAVRTPSASRLRSLELISEIELDERRILATPVRWNFEDAPHGFVHPAAGGATGSLRVDTMSFGGNAALEWSTGASQQTAGDVLFVGFRQPTPRPRVVRFRVRSGPEVPVLTAELIDVNGSVYRVSPETGESLAADRWSTIEIRLEPLLDARNLDRLILRAAPASGEAARTLTIWIDDFVVE